MPLDNSTMDTTVSVDGAGRIVIPKALRDQLRLAPGDRLALQSDGQHITLRPVRSGSCLQRKQGIWVFRSGHRLSSDDIDRVLQEVRQPREQNRREPPK
jgi:AbrB family looped-hinge helix DNA binding protein